MRGDYGGDWFDLSDADRMTIIAPTRAHLKQVHAVIRSRCVARNGLGILKDIEIFAFSSPCGYSGLNFVIRMTDGRPAEIQANVPEVMSGQMSERLFRDTLGAPKFAEIKGRYRIDGGMGHGLYEIYRLAPGGVKGRQAALVSRQCFDYLRGIPNRSMCDVLSREIAAIAKANPGIFHR